MPESKYEWPLSYLVTAISVDRAVIFQFSAGHEKGRFIACYGEPLPEALPKTLDWGHCPVMEELLKREFWCLEDINNSTSPEHRDFVNNLGVRSYLYSPIKIGEIVWGVLGVHLLCTSRVWTASDKVLLQSTASHIGSIVLKAAMVENITLHSRIERSRLLLQKVVDSTPVYIGVKDDTNKFILVNKALSEAAGYGHPKEMVGTDQWGDYFPPNSVEEEEQVLATSTSSFTTSIKGHSKWFTCMRVYVPGDNLLPAMVVSTLVDITPLAIVTARLQDFTHVASHDLQEPLRTITSFLGLLKKRCGSELSTQATHYIDTAMGASNRMGTLLTDLLTYTRLESKAKPFAWVPLSQALTKALKNLSGKLTFEVCPTIIYDPSLSVEVWGDEVQLITCLQNLLSNAIKFGDGCPVEIAYNQTPTHWEVSVVDHGIGVPEGMEEAIFKPFKRAHSNYEGTGMGLAIVEKVANMHGGSAWVTPTPRGGCTVHVSIRKPLL